VFTNINREHLDFFGSYENYVKTKMSLFTSDYVGTAIINTDDFYGRELAYKCSIPVVSYGINDPANSFAMDIDLGFDYTAFIANVLDEVVNVRTPFVGRYNVYNLIGAMTVAKLIVGGGINLNKVVDNLKPIDGRYNVYYKGCKKIIIDFAHTPNSIEELLSHIKTTTNSKIISLFGCVGYSDKDKRKKMGEVVARYSDYIIITTDNIGMANFGEVAEDIILGVGTGKYVCIEDRKTAIDYGYSIMNDGDILVLIGKGAENFQTIGVNRVPYSDKDCVMEIINRKD
jgi:UDP-N-acetylmuramoyl-L-alanyl-D-glutamate--2,6-diaminopimelate ligase